METYYLIPILFLLTLVCILGNAYFENTNEINRLRDALRRSNINDFKAKDRQRLEDIIEQKNLEINELNELKCELTKVKHDYACEVAGGKRGEKEPLKFVNFEGECPTCHGHGNYRKPYTKNEMVTCICCDGTGKAQPGKESRKTPRKKGVIVDCPDCNGEAADPSDDKVCATCNGNGEIKL